MSYTPGPWKVVRTKDEHWRERYYGIWTDEGVEKDRPIANVDGDNAVWLPEGEDFSNALLIAAAPDLLEACKALLIMMNSGPQPRKFDEALSWRQNDEKAHKMAVDAIAKAEA